MNTIMAGAAGNNRAKKYTYAGYQSERAENDLYIARDPAGSAQDNLRDLNKKGYQADRPWNETPEPLFETMRAEQPELLDRVIAYMEEHMEEKLTLSGMAKHFYVSERTISSLFRQRLGVTFYQFLTRRRLIAAKSLILKGAALETVSAQSGFQDYSAFFRAFKKEFGISPREFRHLEEQRLL